MTWETPALLWLLLLLPVLFAAGRILDHRVRAVRRTFFSDELFSKLVPSLNQPLHHIRTGLFYATVFFVILALAGPRIGTEVREVERERLDIIMALDLSLSMKAEDVRPSRLEKARFEINRIVNQLENDRIGLIVFTGHAMLHCPLTTDYAAFRMFLDIADPGIMPSTTTDFDPMFREASKAFASAESTDEDVARLLLLFSDGEDHFDRYSESFAKLMEQQVYVFTIGLGTSQGGRIPRSDPETGAFVDFHRDQSGQVVTTRLVPERLREIAEASGGQYLQISHTAHNTEDLIRQITRMDRSTFAVEEVTRYHNRFQIPALLALLSLFAMLLIPAFNNAPKTNHD